MGKNKSDKNNFDLKIILMLIVLIGIGVSSYIGGNDKTKATSANDTASTTTATSTTQKKVDLSKIPEYNKKPYIEINNNKPNFTDEDMKRKTFEKYSELDMLGRCGVAFALVGKETMPTEPRGNIGSVKPSGWQVAKYDIVDGKYLYNRCHLIGYQLTAENANKKNLITGTRYLNVDGMLPFENQIAEYVKKKNKHVLYRVTPIFKDKNLVASGVQMEAMSVEDKGKSICFNVYVYNNQPGVKIDYKTGKNELIK